MLTRPRDRDVECHASAWNMDGKDDVRIKMCIAPTEEDLHTIYHELGHVYYYLSYLKDQPLPVPGRRARRLPRGHRRHHQPVDDARLPREDRAPAERHEVEPRGADQPADEDRAREDRVPAVRQADRRVALGGVLGRDHAGQLQRGLVGPARASTRASTRPWRAARRTSTRARSTTCRATRRTRATSSRSSCSSSSRRRCARRRASRARCTSARSTAARKRAGTSRRCSRSGASQPWQDTLEKLTGTRQMDASAIVEYFQPLMQWLEEQNHGRQCGW